MRLIAVGFCLLITGCADRSLSATSPVVLEQREIIAPAPGQIFTMEALRRQTAPPMAVAFAGGDGSSLAQAVVINGAPDYFAAADAQILWIKQHYPEFILEGQVQVQSDGRTYDELFLAAPDGKNANIFFDVTNYLKTRGEYGHGDYPGNR